MKYRPWMIVPALAAIVLSAACQSAHTQPSSPAPSIITVPPDEMTKPPGAESVQPAVGDSTPAGQPTPAQAAPKGPRKLTYNSCNVEGQVIAITFDDGPKPGQTDRLLDILKERGIKATFFVIGKNASAYPELIQRMVAEGHEVGNHSYNHPSLTKLGAAGVAAEINQTDDAIVKAGAPKPKIMRPPYGATNAALNRRFNEEFGQAVILWSVDPLDWKIRKASHVKEEILKNTRPGGIVLAHDIHASTVDAMPATLDALVAKGFKFVTVSELIDLDQPAPVATPSPVGAPSASR